MIRYHLDEHVDGAIARGLRDRGVDVTTARDAGLLGAPDAEHLEFAKRESRVIVTHDADFLRLARDTEDHPGVAFCASGSRTVGQMVRYLCLMNDCLSDEEMAGKVEFI
jgi:predicted nuclease of predicted toxin-antitoxin system